MQALFSQRRKFLPVLLALLALTTFGSETLLAQQKPWTPGDDIFELSRGEGGYFSLINLGIIIFGFVGWVILADWVNREGLRLEKYLAVKIEVWNPIILISFLLGFLAVTSIPWFYFLGMPLYLIACFVPPIIFLNNRNKNVDKSIRQAVSESGEITGAIDIVEEIPELPNIEVIPKTSEAHVAKSIQITAKQQEGFVEIYNMLANAVADDVDMIVLEANNAKGVSKFMIDGLWHPYLQYEGPIGINIARLLVFLGAANAKQLDKPQKGGFTIKDPKNKLEAVLNSQPSKKALRVTIKLIREKKGLENLNDIGMGEAQANSVRQAMQGSGVIAMSAAPGQGLTTLWQVGLFSTDRWTRDWVGLYPEGDTESEMENIRPAFYSIGNTKQAIAHIDQAVAKEAGAFALANLKDRIIIDRLVQESKENGRKTITFLPAANAAEALIKLSKTAGDREEMIDQLSMVVYQKLIRKLCTSCKESKKVKGDLIEKLGGDPMERDFVFSAKVPPMELEKDYIPCGNCKDRGFKGRTGIFEVITVTDEIRAALKKGESAAAITKIARSQGTKTLQQAAYPLILDGTTSIEEVKRVCT